MREIGYPNVTVSIPSAMEEGPIRFPGSITHCVIVAVLVAFFRANVTKIAH